MEKLKKITIGDRHVSVPKGTDTCLSPFLVRHHVIQKGRDLILPGEAERSLSRQEMPRFVAVQPPDFRGLKLKPAVRAGDRVKIGSPLLFDKNNPDIKIVSPVSGQVSVLKRGEKRSLMEVVVENDGRSSRELFVPRDFTREGIIASLLESGLWPCLRRRPFSVVPLPSETPAAVIVRAFHADPLAPDIEFVLRDREDELAHGLRTIGLVAPGARICLCSRKEFPLLKPDRGFETHTFSGHYPVSNISVLVNSTVQFKKGCSVWYIEAQDVCRIGRFFMTGRLESERTIAVCGPAAEKKSYLNAVIGSSISSIMGEKEAHGKARYISGNVLSGREVGNKGFLCFYDQQLTVLPYPGQRRLFGWFRHKNMLSGLCGALINNRTADRLKGDTCLNGSRRPIVLNHLFDSYNPLPIHTDSLVRSVLRGDLDEAVELGILECDSEDFTLASFACPSKTNIGGIIRGGLDRLMEEERGAQGPTSPGSGSGHGDSL